MSLTTLYSRALSGLNSPEVSVEVHLSQGLPAFHLVGLPETCVKEAKERVRSAIINSQYEFPACRITINLGPADLPKAGGRFDLAIALGILIASKQLKAPEEFLKQTELIAELSLSGELKPVHGLLASAICTKNAQKTLIVASENAEEAAIAYEESLSANHLLDICAYFSHQKPLKACIKPQLKADIKSEDFSDVQGQHQAKRALEIAAAGEHNILLSGPPGCGKSMLAQRFISILPELEQEQLLQKLAIHSLMKPLTVSELNPEPSFRHPHHSASLPALVGGGNPPQPGEISFAHHGVLFLDELPEFSRQSLEALREPLETQEVIISRAAKHCTFPAAFQLIAAMNPCPCGHSTDAEHVCQCSPEQVRRYRQRLSGPLLDRIDMQINLQATPISHLFNDDHATEETQSSKQIRQRVIEARQKAIARQGFSNKYLQGKTLNLHCQLNDSANALLKQGAERLKLSARATQRSLRTARTIADLAGSAHIHEQHIMEALGLRQDSALANFDNIQQQDISYSE